MLRYSVPFLAAIGAILVCWTPARAAAPFVEKVHLFEEKQAGFVSYRIPGIVVTAKGTVLVFCEARKYSGLDWGEIELHQRRSTDGGRTFSPARQVAHLGPRLPRNPANAELLAVLGELAAAEETLRTYEQLVRQPVGRPTIATLEVYAALGRFEAIADFFAREFQHGSSQRRRGAAAIFRMSRELDPVRETARFVALNTEADRIIAEARKASGREAGVVTSGRPTSNASDKSVAVLAFKNPSGDPAREFFSDGLSEAVTDVLGRVPGLKVVGSASAFSFKGKAASIPEIARQLGVTHLVEGTVLQEGTTVRITAKLIKADGFQVWGTDKLERESKNIFALYDEVAGLIAKNLSLKLGASTASIRREVNPAALELYLQGRQAWNLRSEEGYARAEQLLLRALDIEPGFSRALAALADIRILQAQGFNQTGDANPKLLADGVRYVQQALESDPDLAEAHASRGLAFLAEKKLHEAERSLRHAIALNPNYASAHQWLANAIACTVGIEEALAEVKLSADLDPLSARILENYAALLYSAGRFNEAERVIERAQQINPGSSFGLIVKARLLLARGRADEAVALAKSQANPRLAASVFARAGRRTEAEASIAGLARDGRVLDVWIALGLTEDVISAMEAGEFHIIWLGRTFYHDPACDPFRSDPRVKSILAKLGLTEAHARVQAWRAAHPPEKPAK